MKYFTIRENNGYYDKYIVSKSNCVVLICFTENDLLEIHRIFKEEFYNSSKNEQFADDKGVQENFIFDYIGEDNFYYNLYLSTGEIKKIKKWSLKKLFKQYKNHEGRVLQIEKKQTFITENFDKSTLLKKISLIPFYDKYNYIDVKNNIDIPFRLKKSNKKDKMPLVVYFHGAGCCGDNNLTQLLEYTTLFTGLSMRNCHVLLPQIDKSADGALPFMENYVTSIKELVLELSERINIDFDRIYIIGISYGGTCVWHSLDKHPDFFAGALPLMGNFAYANSSKLELNKFKNSNIWIGHAENDRCVSITTDDAMFKNLSNKGFNVQFSRYKKYGHKMSSIFLRKEQWKVWLFAQKRK